MPFLWATVTLGESSSRPEPSPDLELWATCMVRSSGCHAPRSSPHRVSQTGSLHFLCRKMHLLIPRGTCPEDSRSLPRLEEHSDRTAPPRAITAATTSAQADRPRGACRAHRRCRRRLLVVPGRGQYPIKTDSTRAESARPVGRPECDDDATTHSHDCVCVCVERTPHPYRLRAEQAGSRLETLRAARTDLDRRRSE
jgi:hypothetical protein